MRHRINIGWLGIMLIMAAFLLRVIDVDRRPLHFDEGINVMMGHHSPADVLRISRETFDNDPPGHRFAMGVWMMLAGPSSFAIRIFSVFFSLLAVAGLYRVLRVLHLPTAPSLIAAGLLALSPYAIDYAQQAKGYAMGAGLAM
ncbi:MAG: glycosyltransferase family 39 protein, partial [Chloroflexi bacterium]|nr:glycosyltransferase family 39 protein [Chloroflexota bacterium]